jgi:hypothetical protein
VLIVEDLDNIDADMYRAMDWALAVIRKIQKDARTGTTPLHGCARWPVIVMRTKKGWTGIKELHGKPIEGSWRAHQVCFGIYLFVFIGLIFIYLFFFFFFVCRFQHQMSSTIKRSSLN